MLMPPVHLVEMYWKLQEMLAILSFFYQTNFTTKQYILHQLWIFFLFYLCILFFEGGGD